MRWIRATSMGRQVDINLSAVQSVSYIKEVDQTTFVLRCNQTIVADGDWRKRLPKFMASGASWTDGDIYEYNK